MLTRLLPGLAPVALAALVLGGCSFDQSLSGDIGYRCSSDDDCVADYFCNFGSEPDGEIGICSQASVGTDNCVDRDSDGAFTGQCPDIVATALDCDDNNPNIRPGVDDECDGVDNDCDDTVDEDAPDEPCPLNLGVCVGATRSCVDGAYQDCIADGLYPATYEQVEASCDGLDNDCNGTTDPDPPCACNPDETSAVECGEETGSCTRGVQICGDDSQLTDCIGARVGRVCEGDGVTPCTSDASCIDGTRCVAESCTADTDCGEGGYCVEELLDDVEDLFDDCTADDVDNGNCTRRVCRYLADDTPCATDDECGEGGLCLGNFCQRPTVGPVDELCNGIDDNCDGLIDNEPQRLDICGVCPYNMVLVPLSSGGAGQPFICVDRYEASRPDATEIDPGSQDFYAIAQSGVQPWTGIEPDAANTACRGSDYRDLVGTQRPAIATKRLCTTTWYQQACGGIAGSAIQRPYPYSDPPPDDVAVAGACVDAALGLGGPAVTGSVPECCFAPNNDFSDSPTCDMVGNVAEWVESASRVPMLAGGSYLDSLDDEGGADILSCGDGVTYPSIDDPEFDYASADWIGFRCCTLPAN